MAESNPNLLAPSSDNNLNPDIMSNNDINVGDAYNYICGDANGDGNINIVDASFIINFIFFGGSAPEPMESGDANFDGSANIVDASYLINYIFFGGPIPCVQINTPTVAIPDQVTIQGNPFSDLNLNSYVTDADNTGPDLVWTVSGNSELSITINSDSLASIVVLDPFWAGSEIVVFRATDPGGLWGEDSVRFMVDPDITPVLMPDWPVSTPEEQGLDIDLVRAMYRNAIDFNLAFPNHLYSLLIIKNGYLVAEEYYNGRNLSHAMPSASVTKCYTSILTGIALSQENWLSSLDQHLYEFFPEYNWAGMDSRKSEITLRQMLKMKSGYPWEEREGYMDEFMSTNDWLNLLTTFPLTHAPGTTFGYSNLTAHTMAVITARATGSQLSTFAQTYLFTPLGVTGGSWPRDAQGYNVGHGDLCIRPRDMAKFGEMMLHDGLYNGTQIVPAEWVAESTQPYTYDFFGGEILDSFRHINYGYFWPSATCGTHDVVFAWGHGGQLIVIVKDLNMVVVSTASNMLGDFSETGWLKESGVMNLVGFFIGSLP